MQIFKDILLVWFLIDAFLLCVSEKYKKYRIEWLKSMLNKEKGV